MTGPAEVAQAAARTNAARQRLLATLGEVQARLSPEALAQDAVETATQGAASVARNAAEAVRARPMAAAAVLGAIGVWLARGRIARSLKVRHATPPKAGSLTGKRAKRPKKGS